MEKKRSLRCGFFNPRLLLGFVLGSVGVFLALVAFGIFSGASTLAQGPRQRGGPLAASMKIAPEVLADTADG